MTARVKQWEWRGYEGLLGWITWWAVLWVEVDGETAVPGTASGRSPRTPGFSLVGGQLAPACQLCSKTDTPFQPMADRRSPSGWHSCHPRLGHISEAICVSVCVQRGLVRKPQTVFMLF